jgi:hypothetical protein
MVTVCAPYPHVIAFAAACAEVGAHERKTPHKAPTVHRKEEKSRLFLLLPFEDGAAEEKAAVFFFSFFFFNFPSLVVIFAGDDE